MAVSTEKFVYCCLICQDKFRIKENAEKCFDSHFYIKMCSLCEKQIERDRNLFCLDGATEFSIRPTYGSKLDGQEINCIICDNCLEILREKIDKDIKSK